MSAFARAFAAPKMEPSAGQLQQWTPQALGVRCPACQRSEVVLRLGVPAQKEPGSELMRMLNPVRCPSLTLKPGLPAGPPPDNWLAAGDARAARPGHARLHQPKRQPGRHPHQHPEGEHFGQPWGAGNSASRLSRFNSCKGCVCSRCQPAAGDVAALASSRPKCPGRGWAQQKYMVPHLQRV